MSVVTQDAMKLGGFLTFCDGADASLKACARKIFFPFKINYISVAVNTIPCNSTRSLLTMKSKPFNYLQMY